MPIILRPLTCPALATAILHQSTHYPIAGLEVPDRGADGDDGAGAFVGAGDGEGGEEFTGGDHGIGVAVGGDCYFDEEVVGGEGAGGGDGDLVDAVGGVVLMEGGLA